MALTEADIAELLNFASAFDGRKFNDDDIFAWLRALSGLSDLEVCKEAIVTHYQESDIMVRPAHIIRRARPEPDVSLPPSVSEVLPAIPGVRADEAGPRMVREAIAAAHTANMDRRDLLRRHPDLMARFKEAPMEMSRPETWNGFIPTADPKRSWLQAIEAEARSRETQSLSVC